jgi:rod shape-determining protein MreC
LALSQTPPPLFHQGLSARIRLIVAVAAATALMQLDFQLGFAQPLRQGINAVLYPISELLMLPRDMTISSVEHMTSIRSLRERVGQMEQKEIEQAQTLLAMEQLRAENDNLRTLMGLGKPLDRPSIVAEIRAARPSPLHDLVVINRGLEHGITKGSPVLSSQGVIGQVSRVFPMSAEVRLLSDKQLQVPVYLPRVGVRALTQGVPGEDSFELRHVNLAADISVGDTVQTSGLDGVYPAGLPVGVIISVMEREASAFPLILAKPIASAALQQQVLVLQSSPAVAAAPSASPPAKPVAAPAAPKADKP